jgi:hypothetical protein
MPHSRARDKPQSVLESADDLQGSNIKDSPEKSEGAGLLSFEEEFKGGQEDSPKQANFLADQFFQQSHRIQNEIQSLAEYCKGLTAYAQTPSRDITQQESSEGSDPVLDEPDDLVRRWIKINSMLKWANFQQLQLFYDENYRQVPDASEVATCMIDLIQELDKRQQALENAEETARSLEKDLMTVSGEHQRLQKYMDGAQDSKEQLRQLRAKYENLVSLHRLVKEKYHSLKRRSLRNSEVLRDSSSSAELTSSNKKTFSRYMRRDLREGSHSDKQVLKIIGDFEDTIDKLNAELTRLRSQSSEQEDKLKKQAMNEAISQANWENERRILFKDIAELRNSSAPELVQDICRKLELDEPSQLMKSIDTMQQILKALPSIEQFVKTIVHEVVDDPVSTQLEEILPRIRAHKRDSQRLARLRSDVCGALGVPTTTSDKALVSASQLGVCSSVELFKKLFAIGPFDDFEGIAKQLYMYVQEFKDFIYRVRTALRVSEEADFRQVLRLAYDCIVR